MASKFQFFRVKPFVEVEDYIPFGTSTIPLTDTGGYPKDKPPKKKREPRHRFLKDKDIEKLLDKYFK